MVTPLMQKTRERDKGERECTHLTDFVCVRLKHLKCSKKKQYFFNNVYHVYRVQKYKPYICMMEPN